MKAIFGLGNPGREYENTPHNIGFEVVDELVLRLGCSMRKSWRFSVRMSKASVGGADILLVEPLCYMNCSGEPVSALARYYKIEPGDIVLVADDADLDVGRIRIRPRGGSAGHKGVQSVIDSLGADGFIRVRVGVGRSDGRSDLKDHVLGRFSRAERIMMDKAAKDAADAVLGILGRGVDFAMNEYNGRRIEMSAEHEHDG